MSTVKYSDFVAGYISGSQKLCRIGCHVMTNAIEIDSLTKRFGSFVAVSDVTMDVKKGQFVGLLGPNGAGKSTILKIITGMISASSGSVHVNGFDVKDHKNAMFSTGCVIETPESYPNFTPTEILNYVGKIRGIRGRELKIRITEVLEEVRMWEWRNKRFGSFSKGMKQRVSLAQALLPNPEILILDEPTSGLDPRGMIEVRQILKGLNDGERSLLISTHMLNEVSEVCDAVTLIRKGGLVMSGNVRELQRNAIGTAELEVNVRRPYDQAFMREISEHDGVERTNPIDEYSFTIFLENQDTDREWIIDLIKEHDLGFLTANQKGSEIEDLYMSLTQDGGYDVK